MKGSPIILLSTLLSCASGLELHKRHNPAVVQVDFEKRTKDFFPGHGKRDIANMKVGLRDYLYWANFTLGNPPQELSAVIDTGSSDLVLLTNEIENCEKGRCRGGVFNTEKLEDSKTKYRNLPYALAVAGAINTPAYSMWLEDDITGQFLFGGVNKAKYKEPLVTYPIPVNNESNKRDRALAVMTGFATTYNEESSELDFEPRLVLLDSGTPKSRLTLDMTMHLINTMNVSYYEKHGPAAPCEGSSRNTLDFTFSELTISVPLSNFLWETSFVSDGLAYCKIRYDATATHIILGDDFLKGAYVVFDFANMEISLAARNPEDAEDDIHEIVREVPGASAATGVPGKYLGFDQPALSNPMAVPSGIPTVNENFLSTATEGGSEGFGYMLLFALILYVVAHA
ncbi:aspartic peptidase domain-containing protein [Fusarium redolens]|uniref:Aspartic peptidase domain-containing protein n=1 Tax=Fusarium redolens TaxID=48865 RepID=A0A9P9KE17_FUSRE|nr:aspartic peptidase domain-containing protein [Fusarium redolens]KAH7259092.1 aspartic peptidase domain-containing protein [Fusarium redolens]